MKEKLTNNRQISKLFVIIEYIHNLKVRKLRANDRSMLDPGIAVQRARVFKWFAYSHNVG